MVAAAVALVGASQALAVPPWDGTPISPGLGPTYGEPWCANAAPGSNIALQQGPPLALIPYEAIECSLQKFQAEAAAAGVPQRMTYSVIGQSAGGRPLYAVVVNALETAAQQRDYQRWQQLRAVELENPAAAQAQLASWGNEVKMPVFIEANIHGNEEEGADAIMQALRDLVTTPRGANALVDKILDNVILIVIPSQNPDGRLAGTRANANGFDMNRDLLVQSQPEIRANVRVQQAWLSTVGLALHGYVNPTLIDALTKPHNPGIEYDVFLRWNQRRVDANEEDVNAIPGLPGSATPGNLGYRVTRPVNDWCPEADEPPTPGGPCEDGVTMPGPATAEGWDDWGPFYTQTYISLLGHDASTVEMCSSTALTGGCGGEGRLGSKKAQYVVFYSSMDFWIDNKNPMMHDQLEIYRRGATDAERPPCCTDPLIASRGFTEDQHNWMVPYPRAYVIPFEGAGQRSDAEANRLVQWLLDNGIKVTRASAAFTFGGTTYPAGSYVVFMSQALRGLALTALSAGQDVSGRITQLYAPPGAWSHGLLWGADVVEVPREAPFAPATTPITAPAAMSGGIRGGAAARSDWYSVTVRGPAELRAILALLRAGVYGELAESPFTSTTGGSMPAGTLIFPNDSATRAALETAGAAAGIWFERNIGSAKPPTSQVEKAPRIAILVNTATPSETDQSQSLRAIFGANVGFVSTVTGPNSLQNAPTDPLAGFDVIYNTGQSYPTAAEATARGRLGAFFARGGGYIGTGVSATNFTFMVDAGLVDAFARGLDAAGGGIALWRNVGGSASPISGGYPAQDTIYLPSDVTYFSTVPSGAVVDGRYLESTSSMWVAGLWRERDPAVANAPVLVHGTTTAGSRYMGLAVNPFSRQDAEREWTLVGQAALWSTLTDEADSDVTFPTENRRYVAARFSRGCPAGAGFCGTASGAPGPAIEKVQVAVQRVRTGLWWNGSAFPAPTPAYFDAAGTTNWFYAFSPRKFPSAGDYVVLSRATTVGGNVEATPASTRFTVLLSCSLAARGSGGT
ncbi:MAG TPA: M14 family zinc carboxypeptidase [Gaiellaceae bacterium]|nr:M14 family zinc carboxypeptidase [Gaiellaceae bacterium]